MTLLDDVLRFTPHLTPGEAAALPRARALLPGGELELADLFGRGKGPPIAVLRGHFVFDKRLLEIWLDEYEAYVEAKKHKRSMPRITRRKPVNYVHTDIFAALSANTAPASANDVPADAVDAVVEESGKRELAS